GLRWLDGSGGMAGRVLVLTTDLPFITAEAIRGFLESAPESADIALPVHERQEFESKFPGTQSTYVRLGDGDWTIGGAFLFRPEALELNRQNIERLFSARKSA